MGPIWWVISKPTSRNIYPNFQNTTLYVCTTVCMLTWLPIAVCPNNIGILWKVVSQEGSHWIGSPHGSYKLLAVFFQHRKPENPPFGKWKGLISLTITYCLTCLTLLCWVNDSNVTHIYLNLCIHWIYQQASMPVANWSFTEIFYSKNVMSSWWWLASCVRGRPNVYSWFISKQALHVWYCWWFRYPANQLSLVVYPIFFWLLYIPGAHSEPHNNRQLRSPKRRWKHLPPFRRL